MKRMLFGGLAVALAIGGCPSPQQTDPQPGVVTALSAGSYSGTLSCKTIDEDNVETNQKTVTGRVLVTEEGGLRLYDDNIAPGQTLSRSTFGVTIEETIGQIDQTDNTLTMQTSGSIRYGQEETLTNRLVTLQQIDLQTIEMTDETENHSDKTGKTLTSTCTGSVSQ